MNYFVIISGSALLHRYANNNMQCTHSQHITSHHAMQATVHYIFFVRKRVVNYIAVLRSLYI